MLRTETEIVDAVEEREPQLKPLKDRVEDDYAKWRLEPYQLGKEYDNYTSNEPRTLANKIIDILSSAPLQIRIPLQEEREEERKQLANAERFVYGVLNLADSRLQATLMPSIQGQLAFHSTLRGWLAIRAYIHKNSNGETIPDIKVWDILNTSWDMGGDSLPWVCHTRRITKSQAKAEYDVDLNIKGAKLYDFWDDEIYAAIIGGEFVIKPFEHGLGHIPILITTVGSVPPIQSEKFQDTLKDMGESIYASERNLFEPRNKLMTHLTTLVGLGVHAPIAVSSSGGQKTLERSPYYKGSVVQLDSDKGEKIDRIFEPTMPKDAAALLGTIQRELSMGGMPPIAFGELNFQLPGYGINLLTHAASSVLLPRQRAMEQADEWLARELLTQYAKGGFGKLRLRGRDGSNEYFDVELAPKDVKGDWFPECKLLPVLPEDTAGKYAMAQLAVVNELLSKETARDKLLGVQDPDLETQKILREKAMNMPAIMLRRMAASLVADGRPDLAQIFLDELDRLTGAGEAPARRAPSEPPVRSEYATGMPPQVLPPEEMGRTQLPPGVRERMTQDLRLRQIGLEPS